MQTPVSAEHQKDANEYSEMLGAYTAKARRHE